MSKTAIYDYLIKNGHFDTAEMLWALSIKEELAIKELEKQKEQSTKMTQAEVDKFFEEENSDES